MMSVMSITMNRFFVRGSCAPMPSPIGVIDTSVPSENNAMPTMSSAAPVKNSTIVPTGIGVIVTLSSSTMIVIGRTDDTDSLIFSFRILFILDPLLRDKIQFGLLYHIRRGEFQ